MDSLAPTQDPQRLEALRRYRILDTEPEEAFDDLAHLAAGVCEAPIAMVSLVDDCRQWFKATVGLSEATGDELRSTGLDSAFCAVALGAASVMVVEDATQDERFADTDLVTGPPFVRFYAGAPLIDPDGFALGTLCVIDTVPRKISGAQIDSLERLARQVVAQLELRRTAFELVSAEHAVRESRAHLQAIVDNSLSAIFIKDLDQRYVLVNRATAAGLGLEPEDMVGRTEEEILGPELARRSREGDLAVLEGGEAVQTDARVDVRGVERTYLAVKFPWRDADGTLLGVCCVATDITEREQLTQRLAQSQRLETVGRLAGGVAHDFNNLLAVIMTYADFVAEAVDEHVREDVERIRRSAQRGAELTRQLLVLSRREVARPEVLAPDNVLSAFEPALRRAVREDVDLRIEIVPGVPPVHADPAQIEQALMNLVLNAREAMPSGGTVRVAALPRTVGPGDEAARLGLAPGFYAVLRVTDAGEGMSEEVRRRAVEAFYTTKGTGSGTGLGLATTHAIAVEAGGALDIDSEAGRGTTVDLLLPAAEGPAAGAAQAPAAEAAAGGAETVLVVEDEDALREVARRLLDRHGYSVLTARNGEEALALDAAHDRPIDLLLTDVVMPGISGTELAERMVAERPELPVLYMSGYADDVVVRRGVRQGGLRLLTKPFAGEDLLRAVREALDRGA